MANVSGELEVQLRRYAGASIDAKGEAEEALSVYSFLDRLSSEVLEVLNITTVEELELDDGSVIEAPQNIREVLRDLFWRKGIGEAVDVNLVVTGNVDGKDCKLLVEYHRRHSADEPGFVIQAEVLAENFESPETAEGFVDELLKKIDEKLQRGFSIGESGTVKILETESEQVESAGDGEDDDEEDDEEESGDDEEDGSEEEEGRKRSPLATIAGLIGNIIIVLFLLRSCSN